MLKKIRNMLPVLLVMMAILIGSTIMSYAATALKISKQPVSVTVVSGATAKVTVSAKGDGLSYKWYYKNPDDTKYTRTTTFKGNSYSLKMSSSKSGRKVYCVVTDKYGKSVKSNTVTLKMAKALKITKQPVSVKVLSGKTAKVTVTASGDGLKYKWYYKNPGESKYTRTSAFKGNSYSITMSSARSGRKVYCVVTDKYGRSVKSNTVTLSMAKPLKITKQPVSVSVLSGKTAKVSLTATGEGLTYKWYYKNPGSTKFTKTTSFKSNSYSLTMSSARSGRKVYCVVSDKFGNSAKSNTVTLSMANTLKITKQPASIKVNCSEESKVTVTASGDGLKYKWYHKNADASKYSVATSFTGNSYSFTMSDAVNGRSVYCVVTDKYGKSVKTNVAVLSVNHLYDSGKVTVAATCTQDGSKVYTCRKCSKKLTEIIDKNGHSLGSWKVMLEPTVYEKGYERRSCKNCTYYEDRDINTLTAKWYITADSGVGEPVKIGVGSNGKYVIDKPEKIGYNFVSWKTASGDDFSASGTVFADTSISAQWELDGTDTLKELVERAAAGVDKIKITSDITVTEPVFINDEVSLYADGDYTLKRGAGYAGDILVVGENKNGESAVVLHKQAILNLGAGTGTLTIDGNKDEVTVDVVGSAVFITESATLNMYDGARIANNKKLGNARTETCNESAGEDTLNRIGGAGVININSYFNMYGGIIENNIVATEYTTVKNEAGEDELKEFNGCGGGVYNRGNFTMLGGTIRGNEALRGGGIYTDRVVYLKAGTVSENISHTYGGGMSSSSNSSADTFIGTEDGISSMIFKDNHSMRAGGALYSNTSSPIIIYGNTEFAGNSTDSSGGAIYTAGPLTARGVIFRDNSCLYSGGAIYHHYTKAEFERREIELTECTFENNSGSLGGAVILSAADSVSETQMGTVASITDCTFTENKAIANEHNPGNGGALYITRGSDATISGSTFTGNSAKQNAGAIAMHSESEAGITDCSFTENTAVYGGAVYVSSKAVAKMTNLNFSNNSASVNENGSGGNGGALYIFEATVKVNNVDFYNNSAAKHAGAVYQGMCELTVDSSCEFIGNSAGGHGGAIYMTYKTNEDGTKTGSVLNATQVKFEHNQATSGGAISIRSACEAVLDGVSLIENVVTAVDGESLGGAAVYVGFGKLSLNNVIAEGNVSGGTMNEEKTVHGLGGVVNAVGATVAVNGGKFTDNSASSGGVICASSSSELTVDKAEFIGNKSLATVVDATIGGGAINIVGGTLNVIGATFDGNSTGYYGGAVLARKATVNIIENTVVKGTNGATGAALYFRDGSDVTIDKLSLTDNVSTGNGVVYANGGTFSMTNVDATGNTSVNGGVLYISGESAQAEVKNCNFNSNNAKNGGATYITEGTLKIEDCVISKNSAGLGGGVFVRKGNLQVKNVSFSENTANEDANDNNGNGAAISIAGGTVTAEGNNEFISNKADNHGGAIYISYIKNEDESRTYGSVVMTGGLFKDNSALAGGAASIRSGCSGDFDATAFENNTVEGYVDDNDGDGEGGGAFYVGFGELVLKNVTAQGNTAKGSVTQSEQTGENGTETVTETVFGFGGFVDAYHSTVTVEGGSLTQNKACAGGAINAFGDSTVTLNGVSLVANESTYENKDYNSEIGGGAVRISSGSLTAVRTVFDSDKSGYYGGAILSTGATVTIEDNCEIKASEGSTGAALYFKNSSTATITNSSITNNTARGNGVVYANNSQLTFDTVTASGNTSYNGGVIYTSNKNSKIIVNNSNLSGNSAKKGGVIFAENANVQVNSSVITENTASNGGVVSADGATVSFTGGTVSKNIAENSGGVFNIINGVLEVDGTTVNENEATNHGGVAYLNSTAATFKGATVGLNKAGSNGGVTYVLGGTFDAIENCQFADNIAGNHGGAIYATYVAATETTEAVGSVIGAENCVFSGNQAMCGGAVSIRSYCEGNFDSTTFTGNTVSGFNNVAEGDGEGGGAIYVGYGTLNLTNVTADGNIAQSTVIENGEAENEIAYGFGGAVNAVGATVEISGGVYKNNEAAGGGAINAMSSSEITADGVTFLNNKSVTTGVDSTIGGGAVKVYNSTFDMSGCTLEGNTTGYYGGAVHSRKATVIIDGNTSISKSSGSTGAALYFRENSDVEIENVNVFDNTSLTNGVVYFNNGTMNVTSMNAYNNEAVSGGVLFISGSGTNATISNSAFKDNVAVYGGAAYLIDATVTLNSNSFENNTANLGGAVFVKLASVYSNDSTYLNNKAVLNGSGKDGNGGAVSMSAGTFIANGNNQFTGNNAQGHAGAIYVSYVTNEDESRTPGILRMNGGTFTENSAVAGGAVSSRTICESYFTGTVFTNNSASSTVGEEGGGAVFSNNNTLVLTGVTFDGNTTGYYGGGVSAISAKVTIDGNTVFKNNSGITGVAIQLRGSNNCTMTDVSVTDNLAVDNGSGVVYITGSGSLVMSDVTASGNKNNNGGVLYASGSASVEVKDSDFNNNTASTFGGAIDHRSSGTLRIENTALGNNTAKYGGAVHLTTSAATSIINTAFSENSATEKGGAIYSDGKGKITVSDNSSFKNNTAKVGGAVLLDLGSFATVNNSSFEGNKATGGEGGAIYLSDSSDEGTAATGLSAANVTFTGNTASTKGGAISTDTASPNLVINAENCIFTKNAATGAGGGAVEIQNGNCTGASAPEELKLVFKNCTFNENTAKTTGGAIEIRTSSCAKIDGISASGNSSTDNGGVLYITSNFSRLYLTGTVNIADNTAKNGTFAYLYNNKYTNPPMIYTTDSSSAAWYSEVKGNSTSITFDVTAMP